MPGAAIGEWGGGHGCGMSRQKQKKKKKKKTHLWLFLVSISSVVSANVVGLIVSRVWGGWWLTMVVVVVWACREA
jgi:hypothetical protein